MVPADRGLSRKQTKGEAAYDDDKYNTYKGSGMLDE